MAISHRHQSFNYPEYVSPLPADELIKMGVMKQQLYDQGVEKVQKRIDELDQYGFDLVKEEDKEYFSQEMDKFIKAVNESAAKTDFSVLPNVRNILSIGRPLENDPLLLNAIQSSAEYRRRQAELSKMSPKDRSAANDWDYMSDAYDWMSDKKVGTKLSSGKTYTPYVDVSKYIREAADKMKPIIRTEIVEKNGFLEKHEIEELTEKRLAEWMQNSLPAEYRNQVMLDAQFAAKDYTDEEIQNRYFDANLQAYNANQFLVKRFEALPNRTAEQETTYQQLKSRERILKEALSGSPDNAQDARDIFLNEYYNTYLTGQAEAYAYKQEKEDWKENPYSLAAYNSSLRQAEAAVNLTRQKELYKFKLETDKEYGVGKFQTKPLTKTEQKAALNAELLFKKFTNNLTDSKAFVSVKGLAGKESEILKDILKLSGKKLGVNTENINMDNLQVKRNGDGTFVFRVDFGDAPGWFTGNIIKEIGQDTFEPSFRDKQLLSDDIIFEGSLPTVLKYWVDAQGNKVPTNQAPSSLDNTPPPVTSAESDTALTVDDLMNAAYLQTR